MTPSDDLIRRLRECDADLAHEAASRLAELEAQVAKRHPDIVPGMMRCAKCNFVLIRSTLYVANGTVGAGNNATEPCPNGCGPLWPMTWRQQSEDMEQRAIEQMERAKAAEGRVAVLEKAMKAANQFSRCASEFGGEIKYCGELFDAMCVAIDAALVPSS